MRTIQQKHLNSCVFYIVVIVEVILLRGFIGDFVAICVSLSKNTSPSTAVLIDLLIIVFNYLIMIAAIKFIGSYIYSDEIGWRFKAVQKTISLCFYVFLLSSTILLAPIMIFDLIGNFLELVPNLH